MLAVLALPLNGSIKICSVFSFLGTACSCPGLTTAGAPGFAGLTGATLVGACGLTVLCCAHAIGVCNIKNKIKILIKFIWQSYY